MENLMHTHSEEQNLKTERLISHKCLLDRRYFLINEHLQKIPSHPQGNELTAWTSP